ncbi:MAG: hemerythrin domain-containing protein [Syntrophobacteraceae bacterium]
MRPTEELKAEHAGILKVLDVVESISDKIVSEDGVPVEHLKQIIEFFQIFVDRCHHGKEEDILFPAMEAVGIPREGGPIGVMLSEHERGRRFAAEMTRLVESYEGGETGSLQVLTTPALQYSDLLRSHIWKENNVLFPMADEKLSDKEQGRLSREFDRLEEERIGPGKHEAFHRMIDTLSGIYL